MVVSKHYIINPVPGREHGSRHPGRLFNTPEKYGQRVSTRSLARNIQTVSLVFYFPAIAALIYLMLYL